MAGKALRLISFDAGGVRCLSQLKILDNIMCCIQSSLYPNDPDRVALPCECFDLMSGSDIGGLIAIMLSKLRMTAEDAAKELSKICEQVYAPGLSPEERTSTYRKCIEDLLERRGLPEDLEMGRNDRVQEGCPCFVIATQKKNLTNTLKIRTYGTTTGPVSKITVTEAILATCATQPAFLPITMGLDGDTQDVVGGAMGTVNPCRDLISEAYELFGGEAHVSTILSLGAGHLGPLSVTGTLQDMAFSALVFMQETGKKCEKISQEIESQVGQLGVYYRFSVDQGSQRMYGMDPNDIVRIHSQSQPYLQQVEVSSRIDHCVEDLRSRQEHATLEQLNYSLTMDATESLKEDAVGVQEKSPGVYDEEMVDERMELVSNYVDEGDFEEAEKLCKPTLEIMKSALGPEHEQVVNVTTMLARIYFELEDYSEAEVLYEQVLEILKSRLGETHEEVILTMKDLGSVYQAQDQLLKVLPLKEKIVDILKERSGDTDPETLEAMRDLSSIYLSLERYPEATTLQEHVFNIQKDHMGDVHPDNLAATTRLASTYKMQGRYSDAIALLEPILSKMKEILGEDSRNAIIIMHILATAYFSDGEFSKSLELGKVVVESQRKTFGDNHLETLVPMINLANAYYKLGHLAEAKELASEVERTEREVLDDVEHPSYTAAVALLQEIEGTELKEPSTSAQTNSSTLETAGSGK